MLVAAVTSDEGCSQQQLAQGQKVVSPPLGVPQGSVLGPGYLDGRTTQQEVSVAVDIPVAVVNVPVAEACASEAAVAQL